LLLKKTFKYKKQNLHFNGLDLAKWSKKKVTPFYLYHLGILRHQARALLVAAKEYGPKNTHFCYAVKANHHPTILRELSKLGFGADVVSAGELERATKSKMNPRESVFSGVAKTEEEIIYAIKKKILSLNVESLAELRMIQELAKKLKIKTGVTLRFNPDVKVDTHRHISTGHKDHKFGLLEDDIWRGIDMLKNDPYVEFKGLSIHVGSQLLRLNDFTRSFLKVAKLAAKLPVKQTMLDVGGGLGIDYHESESKNILSLKLYMKSLNDILEEYLFLPRPELRGMKIVFEPGRFVVARCGVLVTKVVRVKKSRGHTFVIVDAGMNELMRPALYDAYHEIMPLEKRSGTESVHIVGPICETSDCFAKSRKMSKLIENDFILVADTGAYGKSMANNYNLRTPAIEYFY
jgi:diaminopimelate decarboxylase